MVEIQKRMSEIRERLAAVERPSEGEEKKLRSELCELEQKYRAGLETPPEPELTPDENLEGLLEGDSLGVRLRDFIQGRRPEGRAREVNQELGLGENQFPINLLQLRTDDATAVAAGTSGNEQQNHRAIIGRIFHRMDAGFMGISMPMVQAGVEAYSVLTNTGSMGANVAAGVAHDADAATFTGQKITPIRLTERYRIRIEDAATLPGLEMALRNDLNVALKTHLDQQILSGNGTAPNFSGLVTEANFGGVTDPSTDADVSDVIELAGGAISPPNSYGFEDVRLLMLEDTYIKLASLFITNDGMTALDKLKQYGVKCRVSDRLPAVSSNDHSILRQSGIASGAFRAVAPVWSGISLLRDEITDARSGIVNLTLVMLAGFKIIRSTGLSASKLQLG